MLVIQHVHGRLNALEIISPKEADRCYEELEQVKKAVQDIVEREFGLDIGMLKKFRGISDDFPEIQILMLFGLFDPKREYVHYPTHINLLEQRLREDPKAKRQLAEFVCPSTVYFHRDDIGQRVLDICREKDDYTVLSAGCSSGGEAYSIAMEFCEAGINGHIVGIDINEDAIQRAKRGTYYHFLSRGLYRHPRGKYKKYFYRKEKELHRIYLKQKIKRMTEFQTANILYPLTEQGIEEVSFAVVCCRNTLKYMSHENIGRVLQNLRTVLQQGGVLFIGNEKNEGKYMAGRVLKAGFEKVDGYDPRCPGFVKVE